jgi:hypothetical protein
MDQLDIKKWLSKDTEECKAIGASLKSWSSLECNQSFEARLWIFDGNSKIDFFYDISSIRDKQQAIDELCNLRSLISRLYRAIKALPDEQLEGGEEGEVECFTVNTVENL